MSKRTQATGISPKVRREVIERDGGRCIICGSPRNIQIAHYISRGRLGLGIPENLACMCFNCHFQYDNGKLHNEIENAFKSYLRRHYKNWDRLDLTFHKGGTA